MGLHRGPALALGILLLGGSASSPASAQIVPTSIRFEILYSECRPSGTDTVTFSMNGQVVGSLPMPRQCNCGDSSPLVVTFSDAATLALFDPSGCNSFGLTTSPFTLGFGEVRVVVTTSSDLIAFCLFDGYPANPNRLCAERMLCDAPGSTHLAAVGGVDPDGDGIVGGIGTGCDNCLQTANADQADLDEDGHGDACDFCFGPGPVDTDQDLVCDVSDNCPVAYNPDQEDENDDGYGDVCQCVVSPEICDDQNACTYDHCSAVQGCLFDPVNGDDFNPCTLDYCDPLIGIVNEPISGGSCDDGDSCTLDDTCYSGACAGTSAVPGEVPHLRALDPITLEWDAVAPGPYTVHDVVRGTAALVPQTCVAQGIVALSATDAQSPPAGIAWWYLVRARHLVCGTGTYGTSSDGTPRGALGCP